VIERKFLLSLKHC